MLRSLDKITYRNGFRLNDKPATLEEVSKIYDSRKEAALSVWEKYEKLKSILKTANLPPDEYQAVCRAIAKSLGV
ncbi:hypothetical protein [Xenorhabdus bovienii]|uniref:hypothetical protein n=1 Tax=Xenorhabdus bovienii TaxID=40576 RepID=UPI0023B2EF9F|nr:hypothetical protein [Xenorhabdus bovienii]MDE9483621.1 hypothetical protein [Xenorhabdus bovienii]